MPKLLLRALLPILAMPSLAQTALPAPPPQLSPKAAYNDAIRPLDLTRRDASNWSDIEVASLKVTMDRASAECAARDPKGFSGDDLIDLVRLCSLGQSWPAVLQAATKYISADLPAKPHLTEAYAGQIDAQLHLKDEPAALASSQAMLASAPYDSLTAETVGEAIAYMQFLYTHDALTLATARQPLLLARMQAVALPSAPPNPAPSGTTAQPAAPTPAPSDPPQSLHELYADGLTLAALQQLTRQSATASAATVSALDAALPATLSPDDALPIAAARKRYALLGKPLPDLTADTRAFLSMPGKAPQLPARHAITALLLYPDWCAQCVRIGTQVPQTVFTVAGHEAYLYGVLAETVAPANSALDSTSPIEPAVFAPAKSVGLLRETPTLAVSPAVLDHFAANDFPFLVLTDSDGIIRVLQPVGDDALTPGGTIDSAIARVGAAWPLLLPPSVRPRSSTPGH